MHGGVVGIESPGLGKGATSTVRLPRIAAPAATRPIRPPAVAGAKRRVVVVDDEMDGLLSLRDILESDGHSVRTEAEGTAGLAAIMEWTPDVAVVDIGLPGIDGFQIAERVRASGRTTYLVALSGYGQAEDKEKARRAGFDEHLTKPADPRSLLALVSRAG
jgi:CheY-like chemotaxis protein